MKGVGVASFSRLSILLLCFGVSSCSQDHSGSEQAAADLMEGSASVTQNQAKRYRAEPEKQAYVAHLRQQAIRQLSQAVESSLRLQESVSAFLDTPNAATLDQAREYWQQAYQDYLLSLAPLANNLNEPQEWQEAGLTSVTFHEYINSGPIEPGYIDYVQGYPATGIINDTVLRISESNLLEQHLFADDQSASIGFHALEFLLWGEAGSRPVSDYIEGAHSAGVADAVVNQSRRRQYLNISARLLHKHLTRLAIRWDQDNGYYSLSIGSQIADDVLLDNLANIRNMIAVELPERYLQAEQNVFSQSRYESAAALVRGMSQLFLPNEAEQGLRPFLVGTPHSQIRLENSLTSLTTCLLQPEALVQGSADELPSAARCSKEITELLSDLDEIKIRIKQL